MAKIDDGEFELVLGNRQLFSAFFVVVVLFAVFFGMGFLIGKSVGSPDDAAKTAADAAPSATTAETRPSPTGPPMAAQTTQPAGSSTAGALPAQSGKPSGAVPAESSQAVPPSEMVQKQKPAEPPPPLPAAVAEKKAPARPATSDSSVSEPAKGQTFIQVAAVRLEDAVATQELLQRRGINSRLAPGPDGLVRVLAGPYEDTAAEARDKAKLVEIGFKGAFRKRY